MSYIGTVTNESPFVSVASDKDIANAAFKAVTFTETGTVDVAKAGDVPIGIIIAETDDIKKGDDVTVQIKDICMGIAGEELTPGAEVSSGEDGKLMKSTEGNFVLGFALEAANTDGIFKLQITKSGYKPAAE